ncbi:hypothetical protein EG329_012090 [Mollisiaceae sp. DMI_Dod_QoI]|nr:hypothetical protein EG329_012090 [Helotiales sp. DMI_Dod_QoI]
MGSKVVDTTYYDLLNVSPTASVLDLKKAYRRAALINHPDKNPGDKEAQYRFQEVYSPFIIAKAYQVLSDPTLRNRYDQLGLKAAEPEGEFEDPSELFARIFGGDAFGEWIGELSYLRDAVRMMAIQSQSPVGTGCGEDTRDSRDIIHYQDERRSPGPRKQSNARTSTGSAERLPSESKSSRRSSNTRQQSTLNQQQKEQLEEYERQKRENHEVRLKTISDRILLKIDGVVKNHNDLRELQRLEQKVWNEAESMKLESFGDQLLHTIGESFVNRSKNFLNAVPIISPLYIMLGDWRREFWDVYDIVSMGLEATKAITALKKSEGEGRGDESFEWGEGDEMTEEKKLVVGKVLAACWKTTVKEVHDITR